MPRPQKRIDGFTLIELLIVIAIILILIAIALPNFIEAQTRAKVAKARADQRSITLAMESYALDNGGDYMPYNRWGNPANPRYLNALSTPIRYFTSADSVTDPFFDPEIDEDLGMDRYGYNSDGLVRGTALQSTGVWFRNISDMIRQGIPGVHAIRYQITSSGPDQVLNMENSLLLYSVTNGSRSPGDIIRFGPFINQ
jgi:prepilin-type N-terminal cleavage/methylation domain-containing protein